ncbi:unnamed protein product, partial [Amoebophrya sp. A25]
NNAWGSPHLAAKYPNRPAVDDDVDAVADELNNAWGSSKVVAASTELQEQQHQMNIGRSEEQPEGEENHAGANGSTADTEALTDVIVQAVQKALGTTTDKKAVEEISSRAQQKLQQQQLQGTSTNTLRSKSSKRAKKYSASAATKLKAKRQAIKTSITIPKRTDSAEVSVKSAKHSKTRTTIATPISDASLSGHGSSSTNGKNGSAGAAAINKKFASTSAKQKVTTSSEEEIAVQKDKEKQKNKNKIKHRPSVSRKTSKSMKKGHVIAGTKKNSSGAALIRRGRAELEAEQDVLLQQVVHDLHTLKQVQRRKHGTSAESLKQIGGVLQNLEQLSVREGEDAEDEADDLETTGAEQAENEDHSVMMSSLVDDEDSSSSDNMEDHNRIRTHDVDGAQKSHEDGGQDEIIFTSSVSVPVSGVGHAPSTASRHPTAPGTSAALSQIR